MNAPSPSSPRPVASPTNSAVHAPAIVLLARDACAANDDAVTAVHPQAPNPLWMNPLWVITAGLGIFFAAMAILVATS
jgi:hypothetical protein